jgi:hypothetical protein
LLNHSERVCEKEEWRYEHERGSPQPRRDMLARPCGSTEVRSGSGSLSANESFGTAASLLAALASSCHQPAMSGSWIPIPGSVYRPKRDDDVGRFGVVKLQVGRIGVAPAGKIHDLGRLSFRPSRLGRLHDIEPVAVGKKVCSPNRSFSCGTTGWSSGMASASNWPSVRSTCAEVSFIAHSFGWARPKAINHAYRVLRSLPPHVVKRYARSSRAA